MQDAIPELNRLARAGRIVPAGYVGIFGANAFALADGSATIQRIFGPASGGAGRIFYVWEGWQLISNGRLVAEWIRTPSQAAEKTRDYARACQWLLLKAKRQAA